MVAELKSYKLQFHPYNNKLHLQSPLHVTDSICFPKYICIHVVGIHMMCANTCLLSASVLIHVFYENNIDERPMS